MWGKEPGAAGSLAPRATGGAGAGDAVGGGVGAGRVMLCSR